jgi:hypothetical protein
MRRLCLLALLLAACNGDGYLSGDPTAPANQHPEFDGARLIVNEPQSGTIYIVDDGIPLDAQVVDVNGDPMDFGDVVWTIDDEEEPIHTGLEGDVEVEWGIHLITATAELPNGDRLQWTAGGLRVQGEHTGIYAGNLRITLDAEFQGTPISASCLGGLDFTVDMSGTVIDGGGACMIDLLVLGRFDVVYNVDASVLNDDAEGSVAMDLGFFDFPVDFEGSFEYDTLTSEFGGGAFLFDMSGDLDAHRVSLYVDP